MKFNICTKKEIDDNGEKKTLWFKVGVLKFTDKGKRYLHLFQQPQTQFYVFEQEEKLPDIQID
ncbi:hypothetical protein JYU16_01130 [bacterium AH-315-M05]|nr:hypothetical protein [bacterium AH-315-M05]